MTTITYFAEKKQQQTNREEIRVPEFGGWDGGRNKGFWPEYLPMFHNLQYLDSDNIFLWFT